MTIMGVVWWIYGIGKQGPAATWKVRGRQLRRPHRDRGRWSPRELPGTATSCPTAEAILEARPASWPSSSRRPRASSARASATCSSVDPELEEQLARATCPTGWILLASSDPQTGEAQAVGVGLRHRRAQALRRAQPTSSSLDAFSYGGKEQPRPTTPACSTGSGSRPSGSSRGRSATRPTTRSCRSSRSSRRRPTPGQAPPAARGRRRPSRSSRWSWSATSAPSGCRRSASRIFVRRSCSRVLLQQPPPARQARRGGPTRPPPGALTGMGQYLPDPRPARPGRRSSRRSASWRRGCWRPRSPNAGQVGALRVRHRARAASRPSASRCASTSSR